MKKLIPLLILILSSFFVFSQSDIQEELKSRHIYDLSPIKTKGKFDVKKDTLKVRSRKLTFFQMTTGLRVSYLPFYVPKGKYFAIVNLKLYDTIIPITNLYNQDGYSVKANTNTLEIRNSKEHYFQMYFDRFSQSNVKTDSMNYNIYMSDTNASSKKTFSGTYFFSYVFENDKEYEKHEDYYRDMYVGFYLFDTREQLIEFKNSIGKLDE